MACDICGKTGVRLQDLHEPYQTEDIKQTCDECSAIVDRRLGKIKVLTFQMTCDLLKRFMRQRKAVR